jgi:hypothetical protein
MSYLYPVQLVHVPSGKTLLSCWSHPESEGKRGESENANAIARNLTNLLQVDNYGVTEFIQGQTKRWGIAWSFGSDRLPDVAIFTLC